jgi:hypothetical protein
MPSRTILSSIFVLAVLGSAGRALAQTGEFASQPPGSVVHQGYALQDAWQNARHRASVDPVKAPKLYRMESSEASKRRDK